MAWRRSGDKQVLKDAKPANIELIDHRTLPVYDRKQNSWIIWGMDRRFPLQAGTLTRSEIEATLDDTPRVDLPEDCLTITLDNADDWH